MKDLNVITLTGRVVRKPFVGTADNEVEWSSFTLATSGEWLDLKSGECQKLVHFHRILAWGELTKLELKKGTSVVVDGELVNRSYENQDGTTSYRTEIVADNITIL